MNKLVEFGNVLENVSFKDKTSIKIGGKIKYFIEVETLEKLSLLINFLVSNKIPYFILGNGTNILASDEDFEIVVISLKKMNKISINNDIVEIEAGSSSMYAGIYLVSLGYDAVMPLTLIPGTVGGIIYMNASAFGEIITDYLIKVDYIDQNGSLKVLMILLILNIVIHLLWKIRILS
jgi:UDP-N-acetylmuramate dehydrogenase